MNSLEDVLKKSKRAMLIGIGGGGDIVGTIPTAKLLDIFGVEYIYGGLSWERSVFDPIPGPRKLDEIKHVEKLNDSVWYANENTVTTTGVRFAESDIAKIYNTKTILVGINGGSKKIASDLLDAADKNSADLIIGIDVGGDAIGFGNEPNLMSPLADAIMLAALNILEDKIPTMLGIFGFGCDGELKQGELENSIKTIANEGGLYGSWGITKKAYDELETAISIVPTEASRLPIQYLKGELQDGTTIRSGRRTVEISISSTVTFYVSPKVVYEKISKPARAVTDCQSLEDANNNLNKIGLKTELDFEREKYALLNEKD